MISETGRVIVMDIGVSEITSNSEHTMHTRVSEFIGTLRTSSPQFLRGEKFDTSDDIYSLGATCYFVLSGKQIFSEVDRKPLISDSVLNVVPVIAEFGSDVPSWITTLIAGALSKERRYRPKLEEFREALEASVPTKYTIAQASKISLDQRGLQVVHAERISGNFFVDIGAHKLKPGTIFKVVRRGPAVTLPSSSRTVHAERMICRAQLRHASAEVAHLQVVAPEDLNARGVLWRDIDPPEPISVGDYVIPDQQ